MAGTDRIEDILGKIGMGTIDGDGVLTSTSTEFDVYANRAADHPYVNPSQTANQLVSSYEKLSQYHIIFFGCSTSNINLDLNARTNLRRYVKEGGKIYVTDWTGEVMDRPFPTQVTFGGSGIDTAGTYDPQNPAVDNLTSLGSANDRPAFNSTDARAVDENLSQWLGLQRAPTEDDENVAEIIDPERFEVTDNWTWIRSLTSVVVGTDDQGQPIENTPKVWLEGSVARGGATGKRPLSVTFEPTGCGRVLFSTYQTSTRDHISLHPQERVLLYLIMEIGACTATVPPVD
jgi:hypothetical protein